MTNAYDSKMAIFFSKNVRVARSEMCGRGRSLRTTNFFTATFLLSSNNKTTKFQLHLQVFAHDSANADANLKFQNPHISKRDTHHE